MVGGNFETSYFNIQGIGYSSVSSSLGVPGCTDNSAANYDPNADIDCNKQDTTLTTYVQTDGWDRCCTYNITGCTDSSATNYNALANIDDGTCELVGCGEQFINPCVPGSWHSPCDYSYQNSNYDSNVITHSPAACIPAIAGCMNRSKANYNPSANVMCGAPTGYTDGGVYLQIGDGPNIPSPVPSNGYCCTEQVAGCTDPKASNYNPSNPANVDDGSCDYIGCIDSDADNYSGIGSGTIPPATIACASCCNYTGCTDEFDANGVAHSNFSSLYNISCDGCCVACIFGCMDPKAPNYNSAATCDDNSCDDYVFGCTNPLATNYDPLATVDDGTCVVNIFGCTDPSANNYDPFANIDDGSCAFGTSGCTDSTATNYDPLATIDDGTCTYNSSSWGCPIPTVQLEQVGEYLYLKMSIDTTGTYWAGKPPTDYIVSESEVDTTILVNPLKVSVLTGTPNNISSTYDPTTDADYNALNWTPVYDALGGISGAYLLVDINKGNPDFNFHNGFINNTTYNFAFTVSPRTAAASAHLPACGSGAASGGCYNHGYTPCGTANQQEVAGCMQPLATNYVPNATINAHNCIYAPTPSCADPNACNYNPATVLPCNNVGCIVGPNGTIQSGPDCCCDYVTPVAAGGNGCTGCTNPLAINYVPTATLPDPNDPCVGGTLGCTVPQADNYNAAATFDDKSCTFSGCTFNIGPISQPPFNWTFAPGSPTSFPGSITVNLFPSGTYDYILEPYS